MSTALITRNEVAAKIEQVVIAGDLAKLTPEERVSYYRTVCESVGLNPLTRPFDYITLNNKLTLYARKDATDQLRNVHGVSVEIIAREVMDDCYVVTSRATLPNGRTDCSIGAVSIGGLKGEAKCNGMMKAETKSKRRVTLSICGLGILDETEIESIPATRTKPSVERTTEDIEIGPINTPQVCATNEKGGVEGANATSKQAQPASPPATVGEVVPSQPPPAPEAYEKCGRSENASFYAEIRKALPDQLKTMTEEWGRAWLKDHKPPYVKNGKNGKKEGSLQDVPKVLFPELMVECMADIVKLRATVGSKEDRVPF